MKRSMLLRVSLLVSAFAAVNATMASPLRRPPSAPTGTHPAFAAGAGSTASSGLPRVGSVDHDVPLKHRQTAASLAQVTLVVLAAFIEPRFPVFVSAGWLAVECVVRFLAPALARARRWASSLSAKLRDSLVSVLRVVVR